MKVGDLVKHFLTEQIGIVIETRRNASRGYGNHRIIWTTQGDSLFGPGNKEWCGENQLEALNESR